MRLTNRVQKLERALAGPPSVLERLQRALDDAAFRLTGRDLNSILGDSSAVDRVIDDVHCSFTQKLSEGDLASLIPELERIAPLVPASRSFPIPERLRAAQGAGSASSGHRKTG